MCGICGISPPLDDNLTKKMCGTLIHRGPDSEGFYADSKVSLGVRRLRIIDLVSGDQPIHNEDSTIWVVFNGEIYNYSELKRELEGMGHDFYTETDTEVLVHGYEALGSGLLQRLRGMFAFAVWDASRGNLLLARDRLGVKPLYYRILGHRLFFASEMKTILEYEEMPRSLNRAALAHYLTYFYNPLNEGFIQGIYKLPPAHYLVWRPSEAMAAVEQYWDLAPANSGEKISDDAAMDTLDGLLSEAVRARLRSDVPLGLLLSGGVDSSVVAAIASRSQNNLRTFTVVHNGVDSEGRYAKQVSELFGTDHREYDVRVDSLKLLPEIAGKLDEPFGDSSIIPTYVVSKEARKHVTVCLTGDGGDELFWGYPWLRDGGTLGTWFRLPRYIRRPLRSIMTRVPFRMSEAFRDLGRYEDLDYGNSDGRLQCVLRLSHFPASEVINSVGTDFHAYQTYLEVMNTYVSLSRARAYLTYKKVLADDFLYKVDRGSMMNSLEMRSPLLDHVLTEEVWGWPAGLKVRGDESKFILKRYAVERLKIPREVIYRNKGGFSVPTSMWFKEARNELFDNTIDLDHAIGSQMLEEIRDQRTSYEQSNRIIALLVLAYWLRSVTLN